MQIFHSLEDEAFLSALSRGEVGIMPTDTIYGIVTLANNPSSVSRLYRAKAREHKPGTVIAADVSQLVTLGLDETILKPLGKYWPGPISIVIPTNDSLAYLRQEVPGLACRIPDDTHIHALLSRAGPLLTSSANMPGQLPATNLAEALEYFGERVDFYLDAGTITGHKPSTVIRVEPDHSVTVLRQGAVEVQP